MNNAGVTPCHTSPSGWLPRHQRISTHTVTPSCDRLGSHHSSRAGVDGPSSATPTVTTSSRAIGSVATKVCRTGWRRSSAQASAWFSPRSTVATASTAKASAASPPRAAAAALAACPIKGAARCQASANPARPMTTAYQPG